MKEAHGGFFERISRLSTGDRAALKRCAGQQLKDADGRAIAVFYRCLPSSVEESNAERWFAAACWRCLWDADATEGERVEKRLGQLIKGGVLSDSMAHRCESLLDTGWDNDGYLLTKLTRILKLLRQNDRSVPDCSALLDDLLYWNNDSQWVQRRWARAIFTPDLSAEKEEETL